MEYEIVYSAALERRGLGLSLSACTGGSTLLAFGAVDSLEHGDLIKMYERAQKVRLPIHRKGRPRDLWHANRSKATS